MLVQCARYVGPLASAQGSSLPTVCQGDIEDSRLGDAECTSSLTGSSMSSSVALHAGTVAQKGRHRPKPCSPSSDLLAHGPKF